MHRAAEGIRIGMEPTGYVATIHPLGNYANVDEWAAAVIELLWWARRARTASPAMGAGIGGDAAYTKAMPTACAVAFLWK